MQILWIRGQDSDFVSHQLLIVVSHFELHGSLDKLQHGCHFFLRLSIYSRSIDLQKLSPFISQTQQKSVMCYRHSRFSMRRMKVFEFKRSPSRSHRQLLGLPFPLLHREECVRRRRGNPSSWRWWNRASNRFSLSRQYEGSHREGPRLQRIWPGNRRTVMRDINNSREKSII